MAAAYKVAQAKYDGAKATEATFKQLVRPQMVAVTSHGFALRVPTDPAADRRSDDSPEAGTAELIVTAPEGSVVTVGDQRVVGSKLTVAGVSIDRQMVRTVRVAELSGHLIRVNAVAFAPAGCSGGPPRRTGGAQV